MLDMQSSHSFIQYSTDQLPRDFAFYEMDSLYERWFHVAESLNGSADHKTHECQVCHLLVRVADHVLATYAKDEGECSETRHAFDIDHLFVRDSTLFHKWTSA